MSYILDALRKADAQRESDPARGIHAHAARTAMGPGPERGGYGPWFWAAAAAGPAALLAAGWYLYKSPAPVPTPAPAPRIEMAAVVARPVVSAPPPAAPALPPPATAVLPPPVVTAPPVGSAPATVPSRAERAMGGMPPVPQGGALTPRPTPPQPAASPSVAPSPSPSAAASAVPAAPPVPPAAGLPSDAPKLVISGGVYSANKAQRMLIVNGQVVGEGGDVGSGVTLEEIKPKTAVLLFRGARYSVGY